MFSLVFWLLFLHVFKIRILILLSKGWRLINAHKAPCKWNCYVSAKCSFLQPCHLWFYNFLMTSFCLNDMAVKVLGIISSWALHKIIIMSQRVSILPFVKGIWPRTPSVRRISGRRVTRNPPNAPGILAWSFSSPTHQTEHSFACDFPKSCFWLLEFPKLPTLSTSDCFCIPRDFHRSSLGSGICFLPHFRS